MADISDNLAEELWLTAHALADAARGAILPHFRATGLDAENKEAGGFDPVTVADHAALGATGSSEGSLVPWASARPLPSIAVRAWHRVA